MNPLLQDFNTPYNTAPFHKFENEDYLPAFKEAIKEGREEINAIINNPEQPTFNNTIAALDFAGQKLGRIASIFFNLNSAETNDEIQKIAQDVSPLITEYNNDITLNSDLFNRIKEVYENMDTDQLNSEQNTLLEKTYKSFTRNGANLSGSQKKKLREIDKKLSRLKLTFGENVLADTNAYQMHLTNEVDLEGLPDGEIEAARQLAEDKKLDGWLITLDYPSYIPFMTYAKNRDLRRELAIANGKKGFQNNKNNNEANVIEISNLRHERAKLLGYETHAHFVLEERMAKNPETVTIFLEDILEKARPAAKEELATMAEYAQELDAIDELQKWDASYYSEKLKQKLFDLDDEKLKPYFQLEKVLEGAFTIAGRLYGLQFIELDNIDVYHKDVRTFKVEDEQGEFVAIFYADFFPRTGKRNGAWMTSYKPQYRRDGKNERPHISIVCNFTRPTKTKPSLLTFNEVTTLFHEFGHALHGMLANTEYPGLSGTSVYWDFVELPSQVLENWCYEKEALELFAKHYQTGETIPMELVDKIKSSSNFQEGMKTLRQISFGLLDMAWHGVNPEGIKDVKSYEVDAFEGTQLYPDVKENCMSTSFSHIFQGGYSAGYYSYKWAEVLDADAFEFFKENGIFDREVATSFKENILSKGGVEDPMVLYKRFRGKEPRPDALLKRAGLIKKK